jgi:hypothetical protein
MNERIESEGNFRVGAMLLYVFLKVTVLTYVFVFFLHVDVDCKQHYEVKSGSFIPNNRN